MFLFLHYVFSSSTLKGSVFQRIIGTGVKTTSAGEAIRLEGFIIEHPFGRSRGTGPPAFPAIEASILIDPDPEDAQILNKPAEQPEGADKHAVGSVMDQGEPENKDYEDGSGDPEVPFEEFEVIEIPVYGLIL